MIRESAGNTDRCLNIFVFLLFGAGLQHAFLWKDSFLFQSQEDVDPIDLNPSHHLLYEHVRDFRHRIQNMPDERVIEIVRDIVCNEAGHIDHTELPHIQEIFLSLKVKTIARGQAIRKILRSEHIQAADFANENIKQIILHHFRQLGKERNQCMASFSIIRAGKVGADLLGRLLSPKKKIGFWVP